MRPVNLIPPEERRGAAAPMRTGRTPYIVIGAMVAVVGAIGLLTTTSNSLAEKRSEVANLEAAQREAQERADALRPFAQFAAAREARAATVESLARSRFDWERVLDELSRIIPSDIWLVSLSGSIAPGVNVAGGAGIGNRGEVTGPALEMVGCGRSHEAVAGFLSALRDIDGVTRVTAPSVARPDAGQSGAGATGGGSDEECRTRDHVSKFEIVVAFDEVPVPQTAGTTAPAPVAPSPAPSGGDAATPASATTPGAGA